MSSPHPAPQTCPRCGGTGWFAPANDASRAEPCICHGDLRKRQRIAAASIPRRYFHCSMATFHDRNSAVLLSARRKVQEFVDVWPLQRDGRGLLLMGGCGSGKTHLAVAALLEIIGAAKPGKVLFSNFQDLIQEIQASFDADSPVNKSELLRPLIDADLLVLDELGSQKPTLFVQDILYYIINSRYNDERATIFTTNYTDDLHDRVGDRLRSRLHEMAEEIRLIGVPDYRVRKNQNTI
jgi:DNA replication protein DnaC